MLHVEWVQGHQISVLKDPWLLDEENPYVSTSNVALEGASVSSLLVTGEQRWDEDLLLDFLMKET